MVRTLSSVFSKRVAKPRSAAALAWVNIGISVTVRVRVRDRVRVGRPPLAI